MADYYGGVFFKEKIMFRVLMILPLINECLCHIYMVIVYGISLKCLSISMMQYSAI